jgi:plastocyanin
MRSLISKKSIVALLCAAVLVIGLAACGGDDDDDTSSGATTGTTATATGGESGATVAVTIDNFTFDAQPVKAGATFSVENKDDTDHTFTADDGSFDVDVPAGKTVTVDAPADAGTYKYHCKIHSSMKGELTVQ